MANIWNERKKVNNHPKRNTYDLSFVNNATFKFGQLTPVFCKEVISGDSFSITPTFGLRYMPMVFPIQTDMRATLHFFYVRNRNLWKDWVDMSVNANNSLVSQQGQNYVEPYLCPRAIDYEKQYGQGTLADYLGVPSDNSQVSGDYGNWHKLNYVIPMAQSEIPLTDLNRGKYGVRPVGAGGLSNPAGMTIENLSQNIGERSLPNSYEESFFAFDSYPVLSDSNSQSSTTLFGVDNMDDIQPNLYNYWNAAEAVRLRIEFRQGFDISEHMGSCCVGIIFQMQGYWFCFHNKDSVCTQVTGENGLPALEFNIPYSSLSVLSSPKFTSSNLVFRIVLLSEVFGQNFESQKDYQISSVNYPLESFYVYNEAGESGGSDETPRPYCYQQSSGAPVDDTLHINAKPFRAYESIYNCFYRNQQVDPLRDSDGNPVYNDWVLNKDGGPDKTLYELHYRNWEQDFLTSSLPSPQQGIAPLVGVTASGQMTFRDEEGKTYSAQAQFAEDGETITNIVVQSSDMPVGNMRQLVDWATSGISINDFRNVNALQRWLETNIRKGYRYKDFIEGHYGVSIRYDELDMPEFIGGVSQRVNVNTISSTVEQEGMPLGDYAGQATCMGQGRTIRKYVDEPGYIIGIMCVTPVPVYSQLLPKHFLKTNVLDYFTPEFNHIGYQPIQYKEVCPVQTFADGGYDSLNEVFGYQRPWYEYIASTDEAHGDFRSVLSNYLMWRRFETKPILNPDFIKIDPAQLNEVFAYNGQNSDKILGQIRFKVLAKRPISRMAIARLE